MFIGFILKYLIRSMLFHTKNIIRYARKIALREEQNKTKDFEVEDRKRQKYIETLKNVDNLPKCLHDDMKWLAARYESNELDNYEGKYAALRHRKLSPPFDSEKDILRAMQMKKIQGVIIRIGIPTRYERIQVQKE